MQDVPSQRSRTPSIKMDSSKNRLIKLNRIFLVVCAYCASLNTELGLPTRTWLVCIDRLTQGWSCVILATSLVKFIRFPREPAGRDQQSSLGDILALNYLPRINEFGKLYFGLVSISIGAALAWRLYLNSYRSKLMCSSANPTAQQLFDAKYEVIEFFMSGPTQHDTATIRRSLDQRRHAKAFESLASVRRIASDLASRFHRHPSLHPVKLPRQASLLARVHGWNRTLAPGHSAHGLGHQSTFLLQVYRVPIRSSDFLSDRSETRWNFLAKSVLAFASVLTVIGVPLFWLSIVGLESVRLQFGPAPSDQYHDLLLAYGMLEQAYACSQAAMFFVFTNVFITIFLADLMHKLRPIRREVEIICRLYQVERVRRLPRGEIHRQQLQLWAYFDNVFVLDDFVSKYSVVSMTTLIIGLSFGQSYLKVTDPPLKVGTVAALLSNFLSFTYLHLVSWHIEQRVRPEPKLALSIERTHFNHPPLILRSAQEQPHPQGAPVNPGPRVGARGQTRLAADIVWFFRTRLAAHLHSRPQVPTEPEVLFQGECPMHDRAICSLSCR